MQCFCWYFIHISDIFIQPGMLKQLIKNHEYLYNSNLWQTASKKNQQITKYIVLTELGRKTQKPMKVVESVSNFGKKICLEWPLKNIFIKLAMWKMSHLSHGIVKISKDFFPVFIFSAFLKGKLHFKAESYSGLDWNVLWKMSLLLNIFNENFAKFTASQNVLLCSAPHFLVRQVNHEKLS